MVSSHVIVYSTSTEIFEEFENALTSRTKGNVVAHHAHDLTQAVDLTRDLSPIAVVVDYTGDFDTFRATIRELLSIAPETIVAGAYHPNKLEPSAMDQLFVSGVRAGAQDFLRRPISSGELNQLLERARRPSQVKKSDIATTIAFLSNKGGVGKSTLAVNAAARLAQKHPGDVLLLDASLQIGVCAPMLNLHPETTLLDAIRERKRLDSTLIRQLAIPHSSGLELLAAPPDAVSATEIDEQLMTRILNLARRTYRFVIVDTFPLFDGIVMSILDTADVAYIVLDNVVPTVLSIKQLLELLDELGHPVERQRIAVNRMTSVAGHPTRSDIESTIGREVNFVFPFDNRALTSANLGQPFALSRRWWSGLDKSLTALVEEIEQYHRVPINDFERLNEQSSTNGVVEQDYESEEWLSD